MDVDLVTPAAADMPERRRGPATAVAAGLARVATAPWVLVGAWLASVLVALPPALLLHQAIASDLGASLAAGAAADGANWTWWQEFAERQPALAATFRPAVIGFAAVVANVSDVLDGRLPAGPVAAAVAVYLLAWSFLLGGALDRYARQRRLGAAAFFAACGVFVWRFLRLGLLALVAYGFLFLVLHPWLFDDVFGRLTRDVSSERVAFAWRTALYGIFLALVGVTTLIFDYARVRTVVEDRRSVLGALAAGARFVRRHPAATAGVLGFNLLLLVAVWLLYALAAPGAGAPVGVALLAGQTYLLARLAVRLNVYASATVLFQDRLAHAGYTAAPPYRWPDSPAVEAIANASAPSDDRT